MTEDSLVVVCIRVRDAMPGQVVVGSVQVVCSRCGAKCWRAPTSMKVPRPTVCFPCAAEMKKPEEWSVYLAAGAIQELLRHFNSRN